MRNALFGLASVVLLVCGCSVIDGRHRTEDGNGHLTVRFTEIDTNHDGTNDVKVTEISRGNRAILLETVKRGETNYVFSIGEDCQFIERGTNCAFFVYGRHRIIFDEFTKDSEGRIRPIPEDVYERNLHKLRLIYAPGKSPF
jgi:hypothetical protein